jgi:hypothetical protein
MIFAPSIWTPEIDGKPALAFEAKKYRRRDLPSGMDALGAGPTKLCRADSDLRIRLARPDAPALYRQAAAANKSSDNKLVYLIELDVVVSFR